MPLYEYRCGDCGRRFEEFVIGQPKIECPECRSRSVQKLLSVFAVGNGESGGPRDTDVGACGSCGDPRGPGACRLD